MKFIYILSKEKKIIDIVRFDTEKYFILEKIIDNGLNSLINLYSLYAIKINFDKVCLFIKTYLKERENKPSDFPQYNGRFLETDIFEEKNFDGKILKLCNTGYDSKIIFLINIYNSIDFSKENNRCHYLLGADNHTEALKILPTWS